MISRQDATRVSAPDGDNIALTLQEQALPDLIRGMTEKKTCQKAARPTHFRRRSRSFAPPGTCSKLIRKRMRKAFAADCWNPSESSVIRRFSDGSRNRRRVVHVAIQCFVLWAIGELRISRAAGLLQKKMWSPNHFVQMSAIDALGKTGKNPAVASELGTFLRDDDAQIRS